jgi:hypothetical protein
LKTASSGRRSLKKYELYNLLFFVVLMVALGVLVSFVFRYYGTRNTGPAPDSDAGVVSETLSDTSDIGMFFLGNKIVETDHQFRSRLEVPVTDDGFLRELFDLPGVEEVTLNQTSILIKKNTSTRWASIQPGVHRIVKQHLHIHY